VQSLNGRTRVVKDRSFVVEDLFVLVFRYEIVVYKLHSAPPFMG
jgi:hypothetical protein